jgi:hypothetical protein
MAVFLLICVSNKYNPKNTMKENTEFAKLDLEGLKKKEKALNISLKVLIGMMIMMVLAGIYLFTKQGFSVFTILPVAFLPILMTNIKNVKKIREMIAEREK